MEPIIIYVMGVSGSGKTTIGQKLSDRIGIPFFEGDDFHSAKNIEKMRNGHPLKDSDRAKWLAKINEVAKEQMIGKGAIIACSALKKKYRKVLASGITVRVAWIFLRGSFELIQKRMELRKDHFMPPELLASQFKTLEMPNDAITIDVDQEPDKIVEKIISRLNLSS
jgi:carbohydrate kinase (thermoresistant glucokinase family)